MCTGKGEELVCFVCQVPEVIGPGRGWQALIRSWGGEAAVAESLGSCNHTSGRHLCGQGGYLGSNKPGEGEVGASVEGEAVWLEE